MDCSSPAQGQRILEGLGNFAEDERDLSFVIGHLSAGRRGDWSFGDWLLIIGKYGNHGSYEFYVGTQYPVPVAHQRLSSLIRFPASLPPLLEQPGEEFGVVVGLGP